MVQYIIRRLLITIPVLFGILTLVFVISHSLRGDPCHVLLGERANAQVCADFNHRYGFDRPIVDQYVTYLTNFAHGDLGSSFRTSRSVTSLLVLSIYALIFATVVGVLLGVISAVRRNSAVDVGTMMFANLGVSIPVFVLGLLLAFTFAILLKNTPISLPPSGRLSPGISIVPLATRWGLENDHGIARGVVDFVSNMYTVNALLSAQWSIFFDGLRHMILPAVALGTIPLAIIARITRSSLLDVLGLDYIRTARAKGLAEPAVVRRHGMPNAMLPVVTIVGLQVGGLLSGAVLTETVFNLSGVGKAVFEAIEGQDYAIIEGFTLVVAIGFLLINLLVDISYAYLDPRIRPS